ncbi:DoxX family protein [Nonomuraea longicatena]|uniref:DoxX family protein n=1 Tax=Nonomuraea longicatena TaxID=83682 RepID=A0ABN1NM28_9ACTN
MSQVLRDLAALVARVAVGSLFFANGWTKLQLGLIATGESFARQGAPAPGSWATVTMLAELIGGALLVAGLAVPVTGVVLFLEALAVFLVARPINPVSANELVALGAAAVLLGIVGAGRISVDHLVVIRRREASDLAADTEADRVISALRPADRNEPGAAQGNLASTGRGETDGTATSAGRHEADGTLASAGRGAGNALAPIGQGEAGPGHGTDLDGPAQDTAPPSHETRPAPREPSG